MDKEQTLHDVFRKHQEVCAACDQRDRLATKENNYAPLCAVGQEMVDKYFAARSGKVTHTLLSESN